MRTPAFGGDAPRTRRQLIGYVHRPMVTSNIAIAQSTRRIQPAMSGDGFMSTLRGIFNKGKQGAQYLYDSKDKIADLYASETGTALRNLLPDSDDTARPGFAGEKHMILQLKNGKNGVANYMGPGTQVIKRIQRGDPGRTPSDTVAKRHDIDYELASGARTKADQLIQTRAADNRMINSLKKIQASRGDAGRNVQAGLRLIQAKTIGEDLGLMDKNKFAGPLTNISDADKMLLLSNRAKLTQEGYGYPPAVEVSQTRPPGSILKQKLIRNINRGRGKLIRGGGVISDFIAQKAVPSLTKHLGLPTLPPAYIKKIVDLNMAKTGKIGSAMEGVAKVILPALKRLQMKKMGISQSGSGVDKHDARLQKMLKDGLMKALHSKMSGSGLNPAGSGFWGDFKKGFTSVFKPFATIAAPLITPFAPEIGVPLGIVGNML